MADEVIALVNKERKAAGLSSLEKNTYLMQAAAVRAEEQAQSFGHTRPDGTNYLTIFDDMDVGYYTLNNDGSISDWVAEDAGMGYSSAEAVVSGWMNSEGHRATILNENSWSDNTWNAIGAGVYYSDGILYWILELGNSNSIHKHSWSEKCLTDDPSPLLTEYGGQLELGDLYYECSVCGTVKYN